MRHSLAPKVETKCEEMKLLKVRKESGAHTHTHRHAERERESEVQGTHGHREEKDASV
jgi:hypothetical protein